MRLSKSSRPVDLRHAKSSLRLKSLTRVFNHWIDITVRYAQANPDDASWSYNERATLSTFAGAAWKANWFALEEFGTSKHSGERDAETGAKGKKYGRCDLYLDNGTHSYAVEAKQAWQAIGPRVRASNQQVKEKTKSAFRDAAHLPRDEANRRLALTFIAPSFPASFLKKVDDPAAVSTELIETWLEGLHHMKGIDALAWTFPACTRCLLNDAGNRIIPGVVAIVRECSKAVRVSRA